MQPQRVIFEIHRISFKFVAIQKYEREKNVPINENLPHKMQGRVMNYSLSLFLRKKYGTRKSSAGI